MTPVTPRPSLATCLCDLWPNHDRLTPKREKHTKQGKEKARAQQGKEKTQHFPAQDELLPKTCRTDRKKRQKIRTWTRAMCSYSRCIFAEKSKNTPKKNARDIFLLTMYFFQKNAEPTEKNAKKYEHGRAQRVRNHDVFLPKRDRKRQKRTRATFSCSQCISAESVPNRPKKTQRRTNMHAHNVFLLAMYFCRKDHKPIEKITKMERKCTRATFSCARLIYVGKSRNERRNTRKN